MPITEPKYPNSAGRLLSVLSQIESNQHIAVRLSSLLNDKKLSNADKYEMSIFGCQSIKELHLMYSAFLEDMKSVDINDEQRDVLLSGLKTINRCIYHTNLEANLQALSDAEKSLLEVCATVLPREGILEPDDLNKIQKSIQELQKQLNESDTDPDLKIILQELIRLSQDSINRFNIYGAKGLKKAFKGMLAEVAETYLKTSDKENLKNNEAWMSINNHLKTFDTVTSKLLEYAPLLENVKNFFLTD